MAKGRIGKDDNEKRSKNADIKTSSFSSADVSRSRFSACSSNTRSESTDRPVRIEDVGWDL